MLLGNAFRTGHGSIERLSQSLVRWKIMIVTFWCVNFLDAQLKGYEQSASGMIDQSLMILYDIIHY